MKRYYYLPLLVQITRRGLLQRKSTNPNKVAWIRERKRDI